VAGKKAANPGPVDVPARERRRVSEGVRDEIERLGQAVDPTTGDLLTRDDI
jgi:hypothetical protein